MEMEQGQRKITVLSRARLETYHFICGTPKFLKYFTIVIVFVNK